MPFIGNQPALSYTSFAKQDFTTSATTSYTLSQAVTNANEIALFINFVRQEPTTAYTASGTALTLTSATTATDDMYCIFLGKALQTVNPPAGSVGTSQLVDGAVTSSKLGAGTVLQVVQTVKTDTFSTTSTTPVDITGMSVSITPSSTSNKIFILCQVSTGGDDASPRINLLRNSTALLQPASSGSTIGSDARTAGVRHLVAGVISYLDSPATTSSITYKLQMFEGNTGSTVLFNQSGFTTAAVAQYASSTITVMEIAG